MEAVLKKSLEEVREGREDALRRLGRALEPMQAALKRQPWVCGEHPAYADYALFSVFQWARVMSPQEVLGPESPLCSWRERLLDLYDGFARNVPIA
jgi:glutathione S-transferase